ALYMAVVHGHGDVARLLLAENASPNIICTCKTSIVSKAAENGDVKILDMLLERGASWKTENADKETPTELAIFNGHHVAWKRFEFYENERIRKFLDASKKGLVDVMKDLILRGGVTPSARGPTGSSALDIAAQKGQVDVVRFLLDGSIISQGIVAEMVRAVDGRGRTVLHWAARNGDVAMVELLL
ncbi:ankyrin repeat-containing domain protein, partial [Tricladium varicosporioides]